MKCIGKSLLALTLIVFVAISMSIMTWDIAFADEIRVFTISTQGGNIWSLKEGDNFILENVSGYWSYVEKVSEQFSDAIDDALNSGEEYRIEFDLPNDVTCRLCDSDGMGSTGANETKYTENPNSDIYIAIDATSYIGSCEKFDIEYKPSQNQDASYSSFGKQRTSTIRFGTNVNVGSYEVRGIAYETINFKGKEYSIKRDSTNSLFCTINQNDNPPREELTSNDTNIIFGKTFDEIAASISSSKGIYKVAQSELDKDAEIGSKKPSASTENQTFIFDYFPLNTNYTSVKDIAIDFTIDQKQIEVAINNVHITVGQDEWVIEPEQLSYYFRTPIEDSIKEDLEIEFYVVDNNRQEVQSIDTNVPAEYLIKARFKNTNYKAIPVNAKKNIYSGGRYFVFPVGVNYDTDDFDIVIQNLNGFQQVEPIVSKLSSQEIITLQLKYDEKTKRIRNVYSLGFKELERYTYQQYLEYFTVTLTPKESGGYIMYNINGKYVEPKDFSSELMLAFESGEADKFIYFVVLEENIDYVSGYMWYHKMLAAFSGVLLIIFVATIIINKQRRWYLV